MWVKPQAPEPNRSPPSNAEVKDSGDIPPLFHASPDYIYRVRQANFLFYMNILKSRRNVMFTSSAVLCSNMMSTNL
jgi:hypothetical protein